MTTTEHPDHNLELASADGICEGRARLVVEAIRRIAEMTTVERVLTEAVRATEIEGEDFSTVRCDAHLSALLEGLTNAAGIRGTIKVPL